MTYYVSSGTLNSTRSLIHVGVILSHGFPSWRKSGEWRMEVWGTAPEKFPNLALKSVIWVYFGRAVDNSFSSCSVTVSLCTVVALEVFWHDSEPGAAPGFAQQLFIARRFSNSCWLFWLWHAGCVWVFWNSCASTPMSRCLACLTADTTTTCLMSSSTRCPKCCVTLWCTMKHRPSTWSTPCWLCTGLLCTLLCQPGRST